MNEETPVEMEQSAEQTPAPTKEQSQVAPSPDDVILAREKAAFDTYVKNQNIKVPDNFKDSGAWFESLKNAQKEYTKSRQEVAELKKQVEEKKAPVVEEIPQVPEILKIPDPKKPEEAKVVEVQPATEDDWKQWTVEFATNNTLSDETLATIKTKTKLPDAIINEYMQGQKAKLEIAYTKAADLVGGKNTLAKMFDWASKNLTPQEQQAINQNLASPSWDVALYGLQAKYEKSTMTSKPKEPKASAKGQIPIASTQEGITAYQNKREFSAERNNPRFMSDPKFRNYVEQRMLRTDFTKLPK